ncbi:MAG: hypothetical protein QNL97_01130 [Pseudomonadales bacterium]
MSMNTPVTFFSPLSRASSQYDHAASMQSQTQLGSYSRERFSQEQLSQEQLSQEKLSQEALSQEQINGTLDKHACNLTLSSKKSSKTSSKMSSESVVCSSGSVSPIADRSELAMRFAKGMVRSRHKKQDGRIVCRLLLDMLQQESPSQPIVRSSRFWFDKIDERGTDGKSTQAEKQFSLSF